MGETCPCGIREQLPKYSDQEVDETWAELRSLQEAGLLFSSDDYLDPEAAAAGAAAVAAQGQK